MRQAPHIVGALTGAAGALLAAGLHSMAETLRLDIGGIDVAFGGQLGLYGVLPAAVAGWKLAGDPTRGGVGGVISAGARMSLLTVALGLVLVLLGAAVGIAIGGPTSVGTSRLELAAFVLLLATTYGLVIVGPIVALALLPMALAWALVVRVVARNLLPAGRSVG